MENFLKSASCLMLILLISTQILLKSPYRDKLTDDSINGKTIKTYETLLYKGKVTFDSIGDYVPNSALVLINGKPYKTIGTFPIDIEVCDGDVVEVMLELGSKPFYVFLASRKGEVVPDLNVSTIAINEGVNYLFKALTRKE